MMSGTGALRAEPGARVTCAALIVTTQWVHVLSGNVVSVDVMAA
jgi:hypothetical protein